MALGLEQRAQRKQMIAQRLVGALALAAELEAPQGPGQLIVVRGAARDEAAEGPQLVLLLGPSPPASRAACRRSGPAQARYRRRPTDPGSRKRA